MRESFKNIKQSKVNKIRFNSIFLEPLLERLYTKQELKELYKFSERYVRDEISRISMFYPVISHSKTKGYRICNVKKLLEEDNEVNINNEINEISHTLNEINSRIRMLKKRQKPLIGALKVLEKRTNNE